MWKQIMTVSFCFECWLTLNLLMPPDFIVFEFGIEEEKEVKQLRIYMNFSIVTGFYVFVAHYTQNTFI